MLLLLQQNMLLGEYTPPVVVGIMEVVPDLRGDTEDAAIRRIQAIYCVPDATGSGGTVISQSPAQFTLIERGETISYVLGGVPVVNCNGRKVRGLPRYGLDS
jgi:beta-lactam-binding protein with PASTA domain